ncbi:FG-GAP repeat domain-containing protein [Romboutsia lituseburensis]|uniref:FG-GAP repeat domain-containing protein n=1 Tax=Romboutsia lituseburensis TaxID=1537 RepID=UPI00215ACE7F|nr:VCBS repeat-containing protein [Romboutsia lituseburensis]MCR8744464.1 VCBS repeat-containing protein [Romboutsia lituseburensis]
MKLCRLIACASLVTLLATGCSIDSKSGESLLSKSPESLLKDKPVYDENKEVLYKAIELKLPLNSSLILPSNASEVGKINEVDLNGDKKDELVVFEKKENLTERTNQVGFMILSKNNDGTYTEIDNRLELGDSIEYANFYDLNGDGSKEIILLVKNNKKTNMYIYNFENNEIQKTYILDPTWIDDREKYLDMTIKIGDMNNDNKPEILMIHHDSKTTKAYASLAKFDDSLELIGYTELENVKTLSNFYITIGTVSTEKIDDKTVENKGIFLDIPIVQDNNYATQILYVDEHNKLKKAFDDNNMPTIKPYYIPLEDINNDKVIDIPVILRGSGDVYTTKNSTTVNWSRWNGKEGPDSGLVFTSQIYYNYQYNYRLFIPNDLAQSSYIEHEFSKDEALFKFYYYDKQNSEPKNLFTIAVVNKSVRDDKKNSTASSGVILADNNEYSFILYQNNIEELKKFKIDANTIKEYFSLIYDENSKK